MMEQTVQIFGIMELSLDTAHKAIARQFANKPRELYDTLCEWYKHKEVNHICDDFGGCLCANYSWWLSTVIMVNH